MKSFSQYNAESEIGGELISMIKRNLPEKSIVEIEEEGIVVSRLVPAGKMRMTIEQIEEDSFDIDIDLETAVEEACVESLTEICAEEMLATLRRF